jgi:endonuclease-3
MSTVQRIIELLSQEYPDASITLDYKTPVQLLVAVILSAQSTDIRVNQITPKLFKKYRTCQDFASADLKELQNHIKSVGLYKNKSKFIKNACKKIAEDYNGEVPDTMSKLTSLPGVARKTANVVLSNAFNKKEGIIVDTHVKRLSKRLGLTTEKAPETIEKELMKKVPQKEWLHFANLLLYHGRAICHARNPECSICVIRTLCPSREDIPKQR